MNPRIAIIGSRDFDDYELMRKFVAIWCAEWPPSLFVSGGAEGADVLGEKLADQYNIPKSIIRPDWEKYGKRAGFVRNAEIVDAVDIIFAFWDGYSKGTENAIKHAIDTGKTLFVCRFVAPVVNPDASASLDEFL